MLRRNFWFVLGLVAGLGRAQAEIDILKPDRMKALIEAAQPFPHIPAKHQERAGGLFHRARMFQIAIQITVAPVDRIRWPDPVQPQQLEPQRSAA